MSSSKLCALSAGEVLAAFAAKSLTPSEYLAACLEQITQFNPKINALAAMDIEGLISRFALGGIDDEEE